MASLRITLWASLAIAFTSAAVNGFAPLSDSGQGALGDQAVSFDLAHPLSDRRRVGAGFERGPVARGSGVAPGRRGADGHVWPSGRSAARYSGTGSGTRGGTVARTHVILDDDVIEAIDQLVGQRGRSRFLEEAARERLQRLELEKALVSTAGILKDEDYPEFKDQVTINGWVRAQRRTEEAS